VVDEALGQESVAELRAEIRSLKDRNVMYKNATHIVHKDGRTEYLEKKNIYEWDSAHPDWSSCTEAIPKLDALHNDFSLCEAINEALPTQHLISQTLKIQHNQGEGGCFPVHFDTDAGLDSRSVTAILYLNEDWKASDGGQLALYPFPFEKVEVEPVADRLVLFSSANMPHRVMPSSTDRYCLTLWLSKLEEATPGGGGNKLKKRRFGSSF